MEINLEIWLDMIISYLTEKLHHMYQGSKCWVPGFPQALNIFHGNSTLHLEFPAGNPAKTAGNLSYAWGIKV